MESERHEMNAGMLEPGMHEARKSLWNPGWAVFRVSEENPGSWDRCIITGLDEEQAKVIARILNGNMPRSWNRR